MVVKKSKKHTTNNITTSIKKLRRFIIVALSLIIIYLIIYLTPRNYEYDYKINGFNIQEKYIKKDKEYLFTIKKNDKIYKTIGVSKYTPDRKLINGIKEFNNEDTNCIIIDSKIIANNKLCTKDNELISSSLTNIIPGKYINKNQDNYQKYKNIKINLDDKTYLIWNYNSFIKINETEKKQIKIFDNDIYNLEIMAKTDKYLVLADYDQKYNYNKLIRLNLKNNKIDEINLKNDISFESRILGVYKNKIYLLDEKNKKEYEINVKKKKINIVSKNDFGVIYKNNKQVKTKINKIINDNIEFTSNNYYDYVIENETLYLKIKNISEKIKISNLSIKNIVYQNNEEVYYITDDKLYKYDFIHGNQEIFTNFEFNFNYENMVVIY